MSKDKYFRKLMKSKDDPVRDEIWENIKDKASAQPSAEYNSSDTLVAHKNRLTKNNLIWIVCAAILFVGIAVGSYYIFRNDDTPKSRYCTINEYSVKEAEQTIKDYVIENKKPLNYIDWYDDLEYVFVQHYILNSTNELICLNEEVIDSNGNFCYLYITDNYTELDVLDQFATVCTEQITHNGYKLLYGVDSQISCVIIKDNGYKYYIKVEENLEQNFILSLVDKLLESK